MKEKRENYENYDCYDTVELFGKYKETFHSIYTLMNISKKSI